MMVRVFANGLGDLRSLPGGAYQGLKKMVLDASLLNTQHYKVWIKGKVKQRPSLLLHRVRVNLSGKAKKRRDSTLTQTQEVEPHHTIQFSIIHGTPFFGGWGLNPL